MISCRDVNNLQMDGMELVAGAAGLDRIVSLTYLVQTKPYKDHMNPGNFCCGGQGRGTTEDEGQG